MARAEPVIDGRHEAGEVAAGVDCSMPACDASVRYCSGRESRCSAATHQTVAVGTDTPCVQLQRMVQGQLSLAHASRAVQHGHVAAQVMWGGGRSGQLRSASRPSRRRARGAAAQWLLAAARRRCASGVDSPTCGVGTLDMQPSAVAGHEGTERGRVRGTSEQCSTLRSARCDCECRVETDLCCCCTWPVFALAGELAGEKLSGGRRASIAAGSGCSDSPGSICGDEAALMPGGPAGELLATLL